MSYELIEAATRLPAVVLADPWAQQAAEWLQNFQSAKTIGTYRAAWRDFLKWLQRHPQTATRGDVIAYRDELVKTVKPSTASLRIAALASFYKHAVAEGLMDRNPAAGVKRPKTTAYAGARWLTDAEARALLQAPDRTTLEGKRDFAIIVAMLTMGLRRAEVAGLMRNHLIEHGDGTAELRYTPKGGEDTSRPVPAIAWRAIGEYLAARGELAADAPVFVAHDRATGSRQTGKPLTGEAIWYIVNRYTEKALGRHVNPHALRHTCANAAWDTTHDLRRVQDLLGHASATTTEIYLHRRGDERGALGDAIGVRFGVS